MIIFLGISLALTACGGSGSDSSASAGKPEVVTLPSSGSAQPPSKLTKPDIQPPSTLPTDLLIRDRIEGSGPVARPGDEAISEYVAVGETGKELYSSWDQSTPLQLNLKLGDNKYFPGLDLGIEGMKAGGRRELLIPASLTKSPETKDSEPLFYVIDLLEINRNGRCWATQPLSQAEYAARCRNRVRVN